jgi:hypothetical protein
MLPLAMVNSTDEAAAAADSDADVLLVYASAGPTKWFEILAASAKPNVMFLRQNSGPFYLYYEIADFRFLRKRGKAARSEYDAEDLWWTLRDVLWRSARSYGLKNARGTRSLAIGGLSVLQGRSEVGAAHVRDAWGYGLVTEAGTGPRIAAARADTGVMPPAREADANFRRSPTSPSSRNAAS